LDLAVLPPAKSRSIGHAHDLGIVTEFHTAMMAYLSLFVNKYHHFLGPLSMTRRSSGMSCNGNVQQNDVFALITGYR
jgi:hypothetical protein